MGGNTNKDANDEHIWMKVDLLNIIRLMKIGPIYEIFILSDTMQYMNMESDDPRKELCGFSRLLKETQENFEDFLSATIDKIFRNQVGRPGHTWMHWRET